MKRRILFVDDEAMVLQGIQRSFRAMRDEWDMDFAEGGEPAKILIERQHYDVVLTDMMMPGMDGAQLLAFVKQRSPRTIRLVLSGHAEQQLAMKCVGLAHQYLAKPCDAAALKKIVGRVLDPAFAIRNDKVMALVGQLENLPSLPAIYSKMIQLLKDPNAEMDQIGALIAGDMAMTAKILQLVNSSFFGLSRQVTKPAEAASFLGMETLKALVLATNVFGQFEAKLRAGACAESASEHSQKVAAASRAIAKAENASRAVVDESLLAGLLHDVGKLVLASSLPEKFGPAACGSELSGLDAELAELGTTHAEIGGYLLGLWGLPAPVVEAISFHHTPGESQNSEFSALTATHVANCLVSNGQSTSVVDMDYLARIGLADRLPAWRAAVDEIACSPANQY